MSIVMMGTGVCYRKRTARERGPKDGHARIDKLNAHKNSMPNQGCEPEVEQPIVPGASFRAGHAHLSCGRSLGFGMTKVRMWFFLGS